MANTGLWVSAPARKPLPNRLTAVVPPASVEDKAAFGLNFEVLEPEATPYPHEVCATPTQLTTSKTFDGRDYVQSNHIVTLYAGVECGFLDFAEHAGKARTKLELGESHALEKFVREDVFTTGSEHVPAGSHLISQFAAAEQEALEAYQGELLAHIPIHSLYNLYEADLLRKDGDGFRTLAGSRVVVGTGYLSNLPPTGGATGTAGKEWVFFTGEMMIGKTGIEVHEGMEPETNNHRAVAEQIYSIAVDGPIVGALLTLKG